MRIQVQPDGLDESEATIFISEDERVRILKALDHLLSGEAERRIEVVVSDSGREELLIEIEGDKRED